MKKRLFVLSLAILLVIMSPFVFAENSPSPTGVDYIDDQGNQIGPDGEVDPLNVDSSTNSPSINPDKQFKEYVVCAFSGTSDSQKCFANGEMACQSTSDSDTCATSITGYEGENVRWSSSCKGKFETRFDSQNKIVEFDCSDGKLEVSKDVVKGKGFSQVYWQCYDGHEEKQGDDTSCKPSEVWQQYAQESCEDRCVTYDFEASDGEGPITKCGVNSFSVISECRGAYLVADDGTVISSIQDPSVQRDNDGKSSCEIISEGPTRNRYWTDLGTEINGLPESEVVAYRIQWFNGKWSRWWIPGQNDLDWKDNCNNQYYLGGAEYDPERPAHCERRIWTYFADHEHQYIKCPEGLSEDLITEEVERTKTDTALDDSLVCRNACPLDGKCYPFGHRKNGNFCSDSGSFTTQLVSNQICENNHECSSNVCIDGTCVDSNFIKKFFRWFKLRGGLK